MDEFLESIKDKIVFLVERYRDEDDCVAGGGYLSRSKFKDYEKAKKCYEKKRDTYKSGYLIFAWCISGEEDVWIHTIDDVTLGE